MRMLLQEDDLEKHLQSILQFVNSDNLKLKYSTALKKLKSEEIDTIEEGYISNLINSSMTVNN